ncbi:MAG: acyl-CoA thioesterase [Verrucomicrobiales bacterium]
MPASRFSYRRRILFHETDLAGIVHFSNFFKYMEEAEHAFVRSLGLSIHPPKELREPQRRGWPRVSASCDFKAPLFFEEEIEVVLVVAEVGQRSIRYRFDFWKNPDAGASGRILAAAGDLVVVRVAADQTTGVIEAVPIPPEFREKIEAARNVDE